MRAPSVFCFAVAFLKAFAIFSAGALAQNVDGNFQQRVSSSVPEPGLVEAPRSIEVVEEAVTVTTPAFTSVEPLDRPEALTVVQGIVQSEQDKAKIRKQLTPSVQGFSGGVPADEKLEILIRNLAPPPAELPSELAPAVRTQLDSKNLTQAAADAVIEHVTGADIADKPNANLFAVMRAYGKPTSKKVHHEAQQKTVFKKTTKPGPPKASLSAKITSDDTFRSNALRSNVEQHEDWVLSGGPQLSLVLPVGSKDTFLMVAGSTSQRYASLNAANQDIGVGLLRYTHPFDHSVGGAGTKEGVYFESKTLVVWDEGFTGVPVSLTTPLAKWFLEGVPNGNCGTLHKPVPCFTIDLSVRGGYTWSSIDALDNGVMGASLGISHEIPKRNLTLSASLDVEGNLFRNQNDRVDGGVTVAAGVDWQISDSTKISAGLSYGYSRSTVSVNDWDGYDLVPQVELKMDLAKWERSRNH